MAKTDTPRNRKPAPGKKSPAKPATAKTVASVPGKPRPSSINVKSIVFLILLGVMLLLFMKNLFGLQELTNPFIKFKAGWVISVQVIIYTLLVVAFGFAGIKLINRSEKSKYLPWITLGIFILIICVHWVAFNPAFEDVDDNAGYMIAAKSLVELGGPYYMYLPEIVPDTEIALGLPLMLAPLYMAFGMDSVRMEILIFLMMAGSVIFMFLLFRKLTGNHFLALIFAILYGIHPYTVAFSSIIMTEIPYMFWSLLALFLVLKFEEQPRMNWLYLLGVLVAIFMTYLTRAVGAGFAIAVFFFLLFRSGLREYLKKKDWRFYKDARFRKFFFLSAGIFLALLVWQLFLSSTGGASQSQTFLGRGLTYFSKNASSIWQVLSQDLFAGSLVRKGIEPLGFMWILVFFMVVIGFLADLRKGGIMSLYTLFVMLLLMLGSTAWEPMVVSRYLIVFIPMFMYFFYLCLKTITDLVLKKANAGQFVGVLGLTLMLSGSFTGTAYYVQRSHTGTMYDPAYSNFIECARWAKDNLPADAIVASRKERIFYIYSDKRGYKHIGYRDQYSEEFEKKKLEEMERLNTSYLILDTFNRSTIANILPIVQKHPDKFKLIKTIGDEKNGPCYVFEVIKWWNNNGT